jgi:hypothetical protein
MRYNNININEDWVVTKTKDYIVEYGIKKGWFKNNQNQVAILEDVWVKCMTIRGVSDSPPEVVIEKEIEHDDSTDGAELE